MGEQKSRPVALITGGTTGIGFATARLLHEQSYDVVVTGVHPERIANAQRTLPSDVVVLRADARSLNDTQAVANEIRTNLRKMASLNRFRVAFAMSA